MTADTMLTVEIVFLSPIPKCSKNFLLCSVLGHYNKPNKSPHLRKACQLGNLSPEFCSEGLQTFQSTDQQRFEKTTK